MTPAQWTMLAIAFVLGAPAAIALLLGLCKMAGEADDAADAILDDMQQRGWWS